MGGDDLGDDLVRFESLRERARGLAARAGRAPARHRARAGAPRRPGGDRQRSRPTRPGSPPSWPRSRPSAAELGARGRASWARPRRRWPSDRAARFERRLGRRARPAPSAAGRPRCGASSPRCAAGVERGERRAPTGSPDRLDALDEQGAPASTPRPSACGASWPRPRRPRRRSAAQLDGSADGRRAEAEAAGSPRPTSAVASRRRRAPPLDGPGRGPRPRPRRGPGPGRGRAPGRRSTACSARCSTWSRSTPAGRPRSRPPPARRSPPWSSTASTPPAGRSPPSPTATLTGAVARPRRRRPATGPAAADRRAACAATSAPRAPASTRLLDAPASARRSWSTTAGRAAVDVALGAPRRRGRHPRRRPLRPRPAGGSAPPAPAPPARPSTRPSAAGRRGRRRGRGGRAERCRPRAAAARARPARPRREAGARLDEQRRPARRRRRRPPAHRRRPPRRWPPRPSRCRDHADRARRAGRPRREPRPPSSRPSCPALEAEEAGPRRAGPGHGRGPRHASTSGPRAVGRPAHATSRSAPPASRSAASSCAGRLRRGRGAAVPRTPASAPRPRPAASSSSARRSPPTGLAAFVADRARARSRPTRRRPARAPPPAVRGGPRPSPPSSTACASERADGRAATLAELASGSQRAELDEAEIKLRIETAVEALRRDLDIEPDTAMAPPSAPSCPRASPPAARVRELERELRLMGPINPLALEEFEALQERHEFLEAQLEDVKSTRRDLAKVIRAVDAEIVNVFAAAFADVGAELHRSCSRRCSPAARAGSGSPTPTTCSTPASRSRPSRRARTCKQAVAALRRRALAHRAGVPVRRVPRPGPSPFYVMDEVEAALDDVNLHRFLDLVARVPRARRS